MVYDTDFMLLKFNLERFIKACEKSKNQKTTKGIKISEIQGTFKGFKCHATFGSGNLNKRPGLAFLKDDNQVINGIYPIILYIPDANEFLICKGVSFNNKPSSEWKITDKDTPFPSTKYNDKRGEYSFIRNVYSLDEFDDITVECIQKDIIDIIEDFPQ